MPDPAATSAVAQLRAALAGREYKLPPRPEVVSEVLALINDPKADSRRLARLVHGDPALAAHVLRVANSPAWCGRSRIVTLQQAVARLGMSNLQEIVLCVGMSEVYRAPGHDQTAREVWRHALATAFYAKLVARTCRENVEAAFLGGLLHSVGQAVVLREAARRAKRKRISVSREEIMEVVREKQREVGIGLAREWDLPDVVRASIEWFTTPEEASRHRSQVHTVALAAQLSQEMLEGLPIDEEAIFPLADALDLYPEDLDAVRESEATVQEAMKAMAA